MLNLRSPKRMHAQLTLACVLDSHVHGRVVVRIGDAVHGLRIYAAERGAVGTGVEME